MPKPLETPRPSPVTPAHSAVVRRAAGVPLLLFIGALLMQTAWVLAVPPFRGIDEFDHAFKAAAVAGGQWDPNLPPAPNGRGDLMVVPRALVDAARPICESYEYTGPDNCRPVAHLDEDRVTIATAASRYNPVFYWLIGQPASWFDGAASLYVMRLVAALICSSFIAVAGWAMTLWARSHWPVAGMLVALSPVAVYSTAVAAPNGAEICAALAIWAVLLGLSTQRLSVRATNTLILASAPAVAFLVGLRQLGPLFLAAIVLVAMALLGRSGTSAIVRENWRALLVVVLTALVAGAAHLWWILRAGSLRLEALPEMDTNPFAAAMGKLPLWLLQTIAAFPTRTEQAPMLVYAAWFVLFAGLVALAFRQGSTTYRWALIAALGLAVALPVALTTATYAQAGPIWQGRYGLPFAVGIPLLAALALDHRRFRHRLVGPGLVGGAAALAVAHCYSVASVLSLERGQSPLSGDSSWLMPPTVIAVALTLGGAAAWLTAVRLSNPRHVERALSAEPSPVTYRP